MLNPHILRNQATFRYLQDPLFHARVRVALDLTNWTALGETEQNLTQEQAAAVTQAAAYALILAAVPDDEFADMLSAASASAQEVARQMGFTVVAVDPEQT